MFFAFPLNAKPDWRNPPVVTLLLILINFVIYFGPQWAEEKAWDKAARYYLDSSLPAVELPRYSLYLRQSGNPTKAEMADEIDAAILHGRLVRPLQLMERDRDFHRQLLAGHIVKPSEANYSTWHEQRSRFEAMRGEPFTERWASNPSDWDPMSLLTSVFLHGSISHLIGNMLFLFVFGYTVEQTLGVRRYLALYLLAGACGTLGDLIARWDSMTISLGASGAISGLMASYAVLYGRQRIRFFYQLLFYFNYVRAPAIILLPAWIAHEFLQQWLNPESGIANMAHAGGLIAGAALTGWFKYRNPEKTVVPAPAAPPEDPIPALLARAQTALKAMKLDDARRLYGQLVKLQPQNRQFVLAYFNLTRQTPADPCFHRAAAYLFALTGDDPELSDLLYANYKAYVQTARPPRLEPDQLSKLALRFARENRTQEAERIYRLIRARNAQHEGLPSLLLALVRATLLGGRPEKALEYQQCLAAEHGASSEARIAVDLLRQAPAPVAVEIASSARR